ncbi:MAG: excinuclease ABC subunit UvrC, partial [Kosmotogaceae bacterium]
MTQNEIRERIKALPQKPGVYIFKDLSGKIIYIGKAKRLRSRVSSYFRQSNLSRNDKIKEIYLNTKTIDFIVLPSEREAMFLEANLIYKHKPKYNVLLTDSHHYPYIRVSEDKFPNITITRLKNSTSGEYFGPYTNVKLVRKLIELLQRIFKIRTCSYDLSRVKRECFLYHLKMCSAPCTGKISVDEYQKNLDKLRGFLNGETSGVREKLENRMYNLSDLLQFEEAKEIRDVLSLFDELYEKQTVDVPQDYNADIITHSSGYIAVLRIRGGMLLGKLSFEFPSEQISDFITQFYFSGKKEIPGTVITDTLGEKNHKEFKEQFTYIGPPRDEREKRLISVAYENIEDEIGFRLNAAKTIKQAKELLGLRKIPETIDGIDISHTQGQYTVASVVVFDKGRPYKDGYRR